MSNLVPLSADVHRNLRLRAPADFSFAAGRSACPLALPEMADAAHSIPIAFAGDNLELIGLMSPVSGRNLYIDGRGNWIGEYIPVVLRTYPFQLARVSNSDELVLCVDLESGLFDDVDNGSGQPLFNVDGSPASFVVNVMTYLRNIRVAHENGMQAVNVLKDLDLLEPWPLQVQVEGQTKTVDGLLRIAEAKLNALSDDAIARVYKAGALPIAYLQLISMRNIQRFPKLMQLQERLAAQKQAVPKPEDMFKMSSDTDVIKFD